MNIKYKAPTRTVELGLFCLSRFSRDIPKIVLWIIDSRCYSADKTVIIVLLWKKNKDVNLQSLEGVLDLNSVFKPIVSVWTGQSWVKMGRGPVKDPRDPPGGREIRG